jgi:hypothetical protein
VRASLSAGMTTTRMHRRTTPARARGAARRP